METSDGWFSQQQVGQGALIARLEAYTGAPMAHWHVHMGLILKFVKRKLKLNFY